MADESSPAITQPDAEVPKIEQEEAGDMPEAPCTRPDKAAHDVQVEGIRTAIAELEEKRTKLTTRIEHTKKGNDEINIKVQEARAKFQVARDEQQKLKSARQHLLDARDAAREAQHKATDMAKSAKRSAPYASVDQIDARLSSLALRQSTESMSLLQERELINEISTLKAQRRTLATAKDALAKAEAEATTASMSGKDVNEKISKIGDELKEANARTSAALDVLKGFDEARGSSKTAFPEMLKERDELRTAINAQYTALKKLEDEFYTASRSYGAYTQALRRWKAITAAKERAARGADAGSGAEAGGEAGAGNGAGGDGEDADAHPYAREQSLCDLLSAFLVRLVPKEDLTAKNAAEAAEREAANKLKVDAFAKGLKEKTKSRVEVEDEFAALSGKKSKGGKGKGSQKADKVGEDAQDEKLPPLSIDSLSAFRLLAIDPPVTVGELSSKIDEVKAKRAAYDLMPAPVKAVVVRAEREEGEDEGERVPRGFGGRGRGRGRGGFSSRGGRGGAAAGAAPVAADS